MGVGGRHTQSLQGLAAFGALEAAVEQRDRQALQPLGQSFSADVRELSRIVERGERFNRDTGLLRELEELITDPRHRHDQGGDAHAQGGDAGAGHQTGGAEFAQDRAKHAKPVGGGLQLELGVVGGRRQQFQATRRWCGRRLDFLERALPLFTNFGQLGFDLAAVDHGQADGEVAFGHGKKKSDIG